MPKTKPIDHQPLRGRRCQFPEGSVRVNLIVSLETYAALDRRARKNGNSLSKEARNAIERHITH